MSGYDVIVIGGGAPGEHCAGAVGVEMAQAVRRLGGEVALVQSGERLLPREPRSSGCDGSACPGPGPP